MAQFWDCWLVQRLRPTVLWEVWWPSKCRLPQSPPELCKFVGFMHSISSLFHNQVKKWLTFNEPIVFVWLGYGSGVHAPGWFWKGRERPCASLERKQLWLDTRWTQTASLMVFFSGIKDPFDSTFKAAHNVIKSHARAYRTYCDKFKSAQKGKKSGPAMAYFTDIYMYICTLF